MKKFYNQAKVELINLNQADIIRTSGDGDDGHEGIDPLKI